MNPEDQKTVVENLLHTLVYKIARRTNHLAARTIMKSVIDDLKKSYPAFNTVIIDDELYSEQHTDVTVTAAINQMHPSQFYNALRDLIDLTVTALKRNADYFFIREVKEAIKEISEYELQIRGINLGKMQSQYIYDRKQAIKINTQKTLILFLNEILYLYTTHNTADVVQKTMNGILARTQLRHNVLSFISLTDNPSDPQVEIEEEINNILLSNVKNAIQELLDQLIKELYWPQDKSFQKAFRQNTDETLQVTIKEIGIIIPDTKRVKKVIDHEILIEKTFEVMISLLREQKSLSESIEIIQSIVQKLKQHQEVFSHVHFSQKKQNDELMTINIDVEINHVAPYKLGKTLQGFIGLIYEELGGNIKGFIDDFGEKMGKDYIREIEKMGFNLHFLEFEYIQKPSRYLSKNSNNYI